MEASTKSQVMLRAFSSRNFRLYYIGQAISLIGTSMTQVATSWLVYRLTDSAWLLGLVGFASQIPTLVLIPLGWTQSAIAVAEITNAVAEIANVVAEIANVVAEITNAVAEIANVVAEIANVVAEITNAVAEIANVVAEIANIVAEITMIIAYTYLPTKPSLDMYPKHLPAISPAVF